jgi:hypothetical protein
VRTAAASCAALAVVLLAPAVSRAQTTCPDTEERLALARERLRADAHDARVWAWSWGLGYSALALGQAGLALTRDDPGQRAELYVGAGKTVLGLVPVLFVPVPAVGDTGVLEGRLAAVRTGDDRCVLQSEGARLLRRSADDEAFSRGWLAHVATVAVNGGGLLIVGLGYHRWATGVAGALVGTAVGELQIFTRPTGALRAANDAGGWAIAPTFGGGTAGLLVAGSFGR